MKADSVNWNLRTDNTSMFKFLRKYNKWILAVGGTLLMIVFLIPQAIENMAQRAGTARATRATLGPDGRERVPLDAWVQIQQENEFLDRLSRISPMQLLTGLGKPDDASHWFLLVREAEAAGLVGSYRAIDFTDEQLRNIAANTGTAPNIILSASARLDGVNRLLSLYTNAGEVSDRRLKQYASRMFHRVEARFIPIEASAEHSQYQPTEEELQQQLAAYGDIAPGEGPMGFGYRLPNRIKLEWIEVPVSAVRSAILRSEDMNNIALRRHWLRESRTAGTTLPPVVEGAEIPEAVREHLLAKLTADRLEEIAKFGNDQLRAARRGLRTDDGYVVLPADWETQRLSLAALAEQIQSRFDIELPAYRSIGDRWLEVNELDSLEGIGRATSDRFGTVPRALPELVRAAQEFGGSPTIQIQSGVAGPPLRGTDNSVYFFRVLDTDASRAPRTVDEAREKMIADLRRKAHYDALVSAASELEREAINEGLLATALNHGSSVASDTVTLVSQEMLRFQRQFGQPIAAMPRSLPGVGVNPKATETIIDRALALPQDTSFSDLPVEQRTFVVPVEDALTVLVVQLTRNMPLTTAAYAELSRDNLIKSLILSEELGGREHIRNAFGLDVLVKRHNFKLHISSTDEEEDFDLGG